MKELEMHIVTLCIIKCNWVSEKVSFLTMNVKEMSIYIFLYLLLQDGKTSRVSSVYAFDFFL